MSGEFAPDLEVVQGLWCMLAVPGQFNRIAWSEPGEPVDRGFHMDYACSERRNWIGTVMSQSEDRDVLLSVGLRPSRGHGSCGSARVLWARVEGKKEAEALMRFRPRPTIVLREGSTSRLVALWTLRNPLSYEWLVRANRRIAHKLFASKRWVEPEFVFPVPGSCLRAGRSRPVPVRVESFRWRVYTPREVVGGLKEAPDPDAWREKAAA